jgi:chromosomal replication initiator protein
MFTFNTFVRAKASRRGYRFCVAMAQSSAAAPRVLLLHGPAASGKSHLARSAARAFAERNPEQRVVITTADALRRRLVEALRADSVERFCDQFHDTHLLVVEDLHVLADKPGTQQCLGLELGRALTADARVIGTATAPPAALHIFRGTLAAVMSVRQCSVGRADRREMRRIVRAIADQRSVHPPTEFIAAVARRSGGDMRRALGALVHFSAASHLPGAPPYPVWMAESGRRRKIARQFLQRFTRRSSDSRRILDGMDDARMRRP